MAQKQSDKDRLKNIATDFKKFFVAHQNERSSLHGSWLLICDSSFRDSSNLTEADTLWNGLVLFHQRNSHLYPIHPQKMDTIDSTNIFCYTSEYRNQDEIKSYAEDIRKSISYPFVMYYRNSDSTYNLLYMHTPDNEFYACNSNTNWKLISGNKCEQMTEISRKSFNDKTVPIAEEEMLLPSQVTDQESLMIPCQEEMNKIWTKEGGKWMVYNSSGLIHQDKLWRALVPLYHNGTLSALKTSTALESKAGILNKHEARVILCYTNNSDDIGDLKATADAIVDSTGYDVIMYYKTNEATSEKRYKYQGDRKVTEFMYTPTGHLYRRDQLRRLKLVEF